MSAQKLEVYLLSQDHIVQRYNTVGDWYKGTVDPNTLWIKVSTLPDRRETWLVAIHELVEAALCEVAGITANEVDKFDMSYPESGENYPDEPGDCIDAPYYRQHQFATVVERLLAAEMGVDWLTYERHVSEVGKTKPPLYTNNSPTQHSEDDDIPF